MQLLITSPDASTTQAARIPCSASWLLGKDWPSILSLESGLCTPDPILE